MATIRIDYDNARACAKRLKAVGGDCAASASAVEKSAGGVGGYWNGVSADAFVQLLTGWGKNTRAIEKELDALADQITRIANQMEEQERKLAAAVSAGAAASSGSAGSGVASGAGAVLGAGASLAGRLGGGK